ISSIVDGISPTPLLARIAEAPFQNSEKMVAVTNMHSPNETMAKGCSYTPAIANPIMTTHARIDGQKKAFRRLSVELLRHAIIGPMPVSNSRPRPIGILMRLKKGESTLIFSPVKASEITGNIVPHSTAKQLASRIRLLNLNLDSRETPLSSRASLRAQP